LAPDGRSTQSVVLADGAIVDTEVVENVYAVDDPSRTN
jgi:hypothetical protein